MALADRFPSLARAADTDHDWLPSKDVTADDLVSSARRSLIDAMRDVEPGAALPLGVDIRLIGSTTGHGSLPADASPIIAALQEELRAAMPRGDVAFRMTGISEGSAVIRIEPAFARVGEPFDSAIESDLESGLKRVFVVHDLLERHAPPQEILKSLQASRGDLLDQTKALAEQLLELDLDLDVSAQSSHGEIFRSKLTRHGGSTWVEHVFESLNADDKQSVISGKLVAKDTEARSIVVRGGKRNGRIEIIDVPADVLSSLEFESVVSVKVVEIATTNRLGRRNVKSRRFAGLVADEPRLDLERRE